ncbi:hypothetical protein FACS1894166_13190 [Bacilli bacterium]|nr:hypothetical protein FACS1894166_13190 [Bacilli bacterium]
MTNKDNSVLDDFYQINKFDPNISLCRSIQKQASENADNGKVNLNKKALKQIVKLISTTEDLLEDVKINDI